MRTRLHEFRRRLGVRGLGLLLIWVTWSLIGLGVYQDESVTAAGAPHLIIPAHIRAALWLASGTLALVLACSRRWDRLALLAAVLMPTGRVTSYLWAWIVYISPGGEPGGYPGGWYNAAIHAVLVAYVLLVAGIVDVPHRDREQA